jgi:polysaccharide export outer membrane protein
MTMRPPLTRRRVLGGATLLTALVACNRGDDLPPLPDAGPFIYKLGPNDQIRVITFGEDSLSEVFRVDDQGRVNLPLLGAIKATGLTPEELGRRIAELLKSKNLLRAPSVSVEITEYRPLFVLGEVVHPGQITYQPGMTVLAAIAIGGGYTYRAVTDYAAITRVIGGKSVQGQVDNNAEVRPGDIITVFERYF